jgi:hypothetical protein
LVFPPQQQLKKPYNNNVGHPDYMGEEQSGLPRNPDCKGETYKVLSISAEVKLLKEEIIYRTVQQQY